jgi:hypothetical protein
MLPKKGKPINSLLQRTGRWYTFIPEENMYDAEEYRGKLEAAGFVDVEIMDVSRDCFPGFFYYGTGKVWKGKEKGEGA